MYSCSLTNTIYLTDRVATVPKQSGASRHDRAHVMDAWLLHYKALRSFLPSPITSSCNPGFRWLSTARIYPAWLSSQFPSSLNLFIARSVRNALTIRSVIIHPGSMRHTHSRARTAKRVLMSVLPASMVDASARSATMLGHMLRRPAIASL